MNAYKKVRAVGRGAHGLVTLCVRLTDGKSVILKEISIEHMTPAEMQATLNEVDVLSRLKHPNVISYYESFVHESSLNIIMEYASRGSLHNLLTGRAGNLIEQDQVMDWFAQITLGLHHIHSLKILHRDLKTQNILVTCSSGQQVILKIGDFGISKVLVSQSKASSVLGTPSYLSPELCQGQPYDERSDIWALGCILYELLTLKRAFEAPTLGALVMKIIQGFEGKIDPKKYSPLVQQLLLELLRTNALQRPTTASLLAHPALVPAILRISTELGRIVPPHSS